MEMSAIYQEVSNCIGQWAVNQGMTCENSIKARRCNNVPLMSRGLVSHNNDRAWQVVSTAVATADHGQECETEFP